MATTPGYTDNPQGLTSPNRDYTVQNEETKRNDKMYADRNSQRQADLENKNRYATNDYVAPKKSGPGYIPGAPSSSSLTQGSYNPSAVNNVADTGRVKTFLGFIFGSK